MVLGVLVPTSSDTVRPEQVFGTKPLAKMLPPIFPCSSSLILGGGFGRV